MSTATEIPNIFIEKEPMHEVNPCMFRHEFNYSRTHKPPKNLKERFPDEVGRHFELDSLFGMSDSIRNTAYAVYYFASKGHGECYASNATIASLARLSVPTVIQNLKVLERQKWIIYKGKSPSGCNVYAINPNVNEHLPITDDVINACKPPSKLKRDKERTLRRCSIDAVCVEHLLSPESQGLNQVNSKALEFNLNMENPGWRSESEATNPYQSTVILNEEINSQKIQNSTLLNEKTICLSELKKNQENSESYKIDIEDTEKKKEEECLSIGATLSLRCLEVEGIEEEEIHALAVKDKEILTSIENPERKENLESAAASPSLRSISGVVDKEIPRAIQTSHHLPLESPTRDFNINNEHSYLQEKIEGLEAKIEGMNMNEEKYRNEIDKLRAIAPGIDSKVNNFVPFIDSNGLDCMVLPIDNIAYAEAFNKRSKQEGLSTFDYILRQCQEYRKAEPKLKEYDELKGKVDDADKTINELTDRLNGFKHKDDEFKQKIEQLERIIDRDSVQLERWEVELNELREERDRMFSSEIGETVIISDEYGAYIYLQKMDESNYEDVYEDEI